METPAHDHDLALLLEHADWVRALARTLVQEASAAEDVVQETWLAALRSGRPGDRPIRAWLTAVARNVARQMGRAESRRKSRERRLARALALPSDRELRDRVELERWVADLVLALDEPYRRVILLRFFEELPPREIARRMSLPVETVKSRLRRGLERLRERVGTERSPNGQLGLFTLLPLVNTGKGSAALGAGALVMGVKTIPVALAAAVLVLLGVLYLVLGGGERGALVGPEGELAAELVDPDLGGERIAGPETDAAAAGAPRPGRGARD